jgi:hypothetical protein
MLLSVCIKVVQPSSRDTRQYVMTAEVLNMF